MQLSWGPMQLGGLGPSTELWDGSGDRFTMVGWMHQRRALHSAPCAPTYHLQNAPMVSAWCCKSYQLQNVPKFGEPCVCELLGVRRGVATGGAARDV